MKLNRSKGFLEPDLFPEVDAGFVEPIPVHELRVSCRVFKRGIRLTGSGSSRGPYGFWIGKT